MKSLFFLTFFTLFVYSCTDTSRTQKFGYGKKYKIEVISAGQIIRTYTSSDKVESDSKSKIYYFMDAATGKLVQVSGDVIITQLD
jgi:uncharacterized protein (DUF2147 family)